MRDVPRPLAGIAAGLLGAVALLAVCMGGRSLTRVPSLPEVLAEWGTFYVPPDLFAYMIANFGSQAKMMLFWGMIALVLLVGAIAGIVYARWPRPRVAVGLALGLCLFTLLVILPASGLGFFGMDVYPAGPLAVTATYLIGWMAFAGVLALGFWLLVPSSRRRAAALSGGPSLVASAPKEVSR